VFGCYEPRLTPAYALSTYVPTHTSPREEKEVRDIYRFVEVLEFACLLWKKPLQPNVVFSWLVNRC